MKKRRMSRKRMLTILLCWALCAADIMPMSITAWASGQVPESITADDNISEITDEDENSGYIDDSENNLQEEENNPEQEGNGADEENRPDHDQNDAEMGEGDSDHSDDSESSKDTEGSDNQDSTDDNEIPDEDTGEEDSESGEEDGDLTEEIPSEEEDESVEAEDESEEQGMSVLADSDGIIEEGTYGGITWKVDSNWKLTVEGTGDFGSTTTHSTSRVPWLKNFKTYYNIKSAEINVTGMTDASYMFYGCSKLTSVSFAGSDTGSVTNMSYMFHSCYNLTDIEWGENFDTGKVTDMSDMFYGCDALTGDDLGDFDTRSVTDMSWMFTYCDNMGELDLSGWDTSQVTDMSYMFADCGFSKITLGGKFTTQNVKNMTYMFYCHSDPDKLGYADYLGDARLNLTGMDLSQLDLGSVEDMSFIFGGCNLKQLDFAKLDTGKTTTLKGLFAGCDLTGVNFSSLRTDTITDMSYFFHNSIGTIDFASLRTEHVTNMSHFLNGGMGGIGGFRENAYWRESIDLSGLNTENVTDMSGMFWYQGELTNLNLSGLDTRNVTNMSGMFNGCNGLTTIDLSHLDTGKVTDMALMFFGCRGLTEIDLSSMDTGKVTDMAAMFSGCTGLTEIDLSVLDTGNVTDMNGMFYMCSSLKNIKMGNLGSAKLEMVIVDGYKQSPLYEMFCMCSSLESVDLSRFNLENLSRIYMSLSGCTKLTAIYTPYNVKVNEELPVEKSGDVWYRANGEQVTTLPKNLSYSVLITRNKIPDVTEPHLEVSKVKTAYLCGEPLTVDDLTVVYYDSEGSVRTITEGFITNAADIDMSTPGIKTLTVTYTDSDKNITLTTDIIITVTLGLTDDNTTITLPEESLVYNGYAQKPVPTVKVKADESAQESGTGITLVEGTDYTVSYQNNTNAGNAAVIITGMGIYSGTVSYGFTIDKALLTVKVKDTNIAKGDKVPEEFEYETVGLASADLSKDSLIKIGSYTFIKHTEGDEAADSTVERSDIDTSLSSEESGFFYYVIPNNVTAGTNYDVNQGVSVESIRGKLTITEERVIYTVTFDVMGHGTMIAPITGIKAGSLITEPTAPETEGYVFTGWYKDTTFAAKQKWNFETDTVQSNTTLYACWIEKAAEDGSGLQLSIQDIQDQYYTGNAVKPTVYVYAADGRTLLKSGKDYTIKYVNNTVADTEEERTQGGIGSDINDTSKGFNKGMAYVVITGKGNYSETIYKNFHILPAKISADDENVAAGFTLKYTEQLVVNKSKDQKPFASLKYKKAMKAGTDYEVKLTALEAYKSDNTAVPEGEVISASNGTTLPTIPKGHSGVFRMTVTGKGNYSGSFAKTILVAGKNQLMKNAAVSIGKNQKSRVYDGKAAVTLTPGWYDKDKKKYYKADENGDAQEADAKDIFTVKAGNEYLKSGLDYTVSYANNKAVGTATMTITGNPEKGYYGSKSVTFKLTGKSFSAKTINVDGFVNSTSYTGKALTQNKVTLTPTAGDAEPQALLYGTHYTISYKNNIKKGTATMTFTAKPESGYSGSFKQTFKITAQSLRQVSFNEADIAVIGEDESKNTKVIRWSNSKPATYSKNGATLSFALKNAENMELKQGTDYTVSYKNNKASAEITAANPPTLTIKGKGNYAGTLTVTFPIQKADIETALGEDGNLTVSASSVAMKDNMQFKDFKFKVLDGKKTLGMGNDKDYTLDETACTSEIIKEYAEALNRKQESGTLITVQEPKVIITGVGNYTGEKEISLADYIYVAKLTSKNLKIDVVGDRTYIGSDGKVEPAVTVSYYPDNNAGKADARPDDTFTEADYTVTYGANNTAGKNKGSVTITGKGFYGGSVTVKFDILKRSIYNK